MNIRHSIFLLMPVVAALFFAQCKKADDAIYNARFYTTQATGKLLLYIDGANRGELPYFAAPPVCGQSYGDGGEPLSIQLRSGEYRIVGKDEQGVERSVSTMRIGRSKMGASGGTGGLRMDANGDCLAVGLWGN